MNNDKKTFEYEEYKPGDAVIQAQEMLKQQIAQKPGTYQSGWQTMLDDSIKKILNREPFKYDLNGDALYQQHKNQAVMQGRQAMMDTMGQAAALTGGYGNSYAQTAGQQAYQGHLQQLNDVIPELYQLALSKYQMEGDDLAQQMAILAQQEEQDYGRYRDQLGDWQTETGRLQDQYDTERDYDYGKWADGRDFAYGQYADDRAYDYQAGRDQVADAQWQKEFDEAMRRWNHENGIVTPTDPADGNGGSNNADNPVIGPNLQIQNPQDQPVVEPTANPNDALVTKSGIMILQKELGLKTTGVWDEETAAAAQQRWGTTSAHEAVISYQESKGQSVTTNKSGNGWIAIGNTRYTYEELAEMVDNGEVKETVDPRTGKYTYTRVVK